MITTTDRTTVTGVAIQNFGAFHNPGVYRVEWPAEEGYYFATRSHMTSVAHWGGARTDYYAPRCIGCRWHGPTFYVTPEGVHTTRGWAKGDVQEGVLAGGTRADMNAMIDAAALAHIHEVAAEHLVLA